MARGQPARSATSRRRCELDELGAPTTIMASTTGATFAPRPGGWWWRSRCPPCAARRCRGKRRLSASTMAAVSSTDSVVCVTKASLPASRGREFLDVLQGLDQGDGAGRQLAHGADHFGMAGMADQHDLAAAAEMDLGLAVHLGDQRAGGVEREQVAARRLLGNRARHAVGGEDDRRLGVRGSPSSSSTKMAPLALQAFDHVAVVDDLVADIDRRRRRCASARSTDSMARTTPAQKPRGEHSSTFKTGFSAAINTSRSGGIPYARHGARRPPLSSRDHCMGRTEPLYSGHFPIIADDLVLRPKGGRSVRRISP